MYILLPIIGMSALMYLHTMFFGIPIANGKSKTFNLALESVSVRIPQWIYIGIMLYMFLTGLTEYASYMGFGMVYYFLITQTISLIKETELKNFFTVPLLLFVSYMYIMSDTWQMMVLISMWTIYSICSFISNRVKLISSAHEQAW